MSKPFDVVLKEMLSDNAVDYGPAFGLPAQLPAKVLTNDLSTLTAATDVAVGYGEPLDWIADYNFQSGPDASVDTRMLMYGAALRLKHGVPVRSVLVLLCPKANLLDLNGHFGYTLGGTRVEFQYEVVRMWEQPVEPFLAGGVGLLPLAPLCRLPDAEPREVALRRVVHEIDRRLLTEMPRPEAARMMTAAFILIGLVLERSRLNTIYDGVRVMHESSAYEIILDQGREKWERKQSRKLLLQQGRARFGPPPEGTEAALEAIADLDRLERMAVAVLTANSWAELLATP